jgi:hypothetical protein
MIPTMPYKFADVRRLDSIIDSLTSIVVSVELRNSQMALPNCEDDVNRETR